MNQSNQRGFTKIDLLITVVVIAVISTLGAVWLSYSKVSNKITKCADNLRILGASVQLYSAQNSDKLPYAFYHIGDHDKTSWDTLVRPFARASLRGVDLNQPAPGTNEFKKILLCPDDDTAPRDWGKPQGRRTYSMPWHNMAPENWPPAGTNNTGMGLGWKTGSKGNAAISSVKQQGGVLPAIKLAIVLDAKSTLLLAEQSRSNNIIGNSSGATIRNTSEHIEKRDDREPLPYHRQKLNYLLIDGHVELLAPTETVGNGVMGGTNAPRGKWTLNPQD